MVKDGEDWNGLETTNLKSLAKLFKRDWAFLIHKSPETDTRCGHLPTKAISEREKLLIFEKYNQSNTAGPLVYSWFYEKFPPFPLYIRNTSIHPNFDYLLLDK